MTRKADLRYRVVIRPLTKGEGGGWLAEIPDLPGCISDGDCPEAALRNIAEAQEAWIAAQEEQGGPIPAPAAGLEEYSGKFTLRLPRSLHRQLSLQADAEGVSLNQYILHLISCGAGQALCPPAAKGGAATLQSGRSRSFPPAGLPAASQRRIASSRARKRRKDPGA